LILILNRFENGEHTPEDMEWLKHEYAERFIESTYDAVVLMGIHGTMINKLKKIISIESLE